MSKFNIISQWNRVYSMAKRNLKISSAAICSTFISVLGIALTSEHISGEDAVLIPYLHWQNWQFYAVAIDISVNSISEMLIFKG